MSIFDVFGFLKDLGELKADTKNLLIAVLFGYILRASSDWFKNRNIKKSNKKMRVILAEIAVSSKLSVLSKTLVKKIKESIGE